MDLPGVQLEGASPQPFDAPGLTTPPACTQWCQQHAGCTQSVFTAAPLACTLYAGQTEKATGWSDTSNSSYCGTVAEKDALLEKLRRVYTLKPYVPPAANGIPGACAWGGQNCLESKCCADNPKCDENFQNCQPYTCYKKDVYFASCHVGGPEGGWDGTVLGGHTAAELPKAAGGVPITGTRLFCFSVVMWNAGPTMPGTDGEGTLANWIKAQGYGILECDESMWIDGVPTGSVHNIDSFVNAWTKVKEDGRWESADWTVKADVDAVFFPERLKWHIGALRPPEGARAYLRNTDFKFHFLGAIEVLSREALRTYYSRGQECQEHLTKEGGEDYWMLQCLEGIGVDFMSDYQLLQDKYAAEENCNDDWAVAFHFYKGHSDWDWCRNAAIAAYNAKNPEAAATMPASPPALR
mmetsp:Transcript_29471/g.77976  ORF Transcript_29471/g.77976 Transcript_29471/m.77976 type:complete len:410 (-) Transcript_29471:76-1305(-)